MRARRALARLCDLFFIGLPWSGLVGLAVTPYRGNWIGGLGLLFVVVMACGASSFALLLLQVALLVKFRASLGMALFDIGFVRGSRWGALGLGLVLAGAVFGASVLSTAVGSALEFAPLAALPLALAIDLAPLWMRAQRTLIDRLSRSVVVRLPPSAPALRDGWAKLIDVSVPVLAGAPLVPFLALSEARAAAVAQALA